MPSLFRVSLVLALLALGTPARAQPLPPPEPSSVSSGMPAAGPSALPSEPPATESQPAPEAAAPAPVEPPPVVEPARPLPGAKHTFETRIEAPAPTSAASAETIRDRDLELRFYPTPEDILRAVPGLVIAQHQGGGKADQLFLRGFDADHGTDVALFIDGVPINLPSNGHGQGYADLHFLIPETIDRVEVTKGPYFVETGDFDTAGAVNLRTRRAFGESSVSGEYGSFDTWRVLGIASPLGDAQPTWFAVELYGTNGPFQTPEGLLRYNLFLKSTLSLSASTRLSILGTAYGSQWTSSGQIPARFVDLPPDDPRHLDRFGSIDSTEGGQTQRQMLLLTLESRPSQSDQIIVAAYGVRYSLRLYNDFTFQLSDPAHFDEIEQNDQRYYLGFNALYRKRIDFGEVRTVTSLGAQARLDSMNVSLSHVQKRARLENCVFADPAATPPTAAVVNPCDDSDVVQSDLAAFAQEDVRFNRWLRMLVGVRADLFEWNVTNKLAFDTAAVPGSNQGTGVVQRGIVNPKLQIVITPLPVWDLYLDAGGGFHSNDARAVAVTDGNGALPRAWGAELGTRLSLVDGRLDIAAALWLLHLQSEQVFVADVGGTVASDPTNRYGLDLELRYQILSWLWADLDLSFAHAEFTQDQGNGSAVALAPTFVGQAGLSALHPSGFRGRLGARWLGDRPATPDGSLTAQGYFVVDLTLAYRWRSLEAALAIQNLFNAEYREAQFATTSIVRIPPYNETVPVNDIHFTPGNPLGVYGTLTLFF
jgi:outer membrane receptor protein involved in Fe transport